MTSTPFVSIILPIYNEENYLPDCLSRLRQVAYPEDCYEIITVDNGSQDNSLAIAKTQADQALYLPEGNVGAVRNFGVEHAKGEIIAFLDSDCLVPTEWLNYGTGQLLADSTKVLGGNLYLRDDPAWIEKYWLLHNPEAPLLQKDLLGSCIFIRKSDFLAAGGFNEIVSSGEDSELSETLRLIGKKVIIDPELGVVHLGNPTTIKSFIQRQAWHAENYFIRWKESISDKTFWLVVAYLCALVIMVVSLLSASHMALIACLILLVIPAFFSVKRITRAHYKPPSLLSLIAIYFIDTLYINGRGVGLIRSAWKAFLSQKASG